MNLISRCPLTLNPETVVSGNFFFYCILFQAARIIAKLAAWGRELMEGSDLNYYFNWIKTQLSSQVKTYFCLNVRMTLETPALEIST